MDKIRDNIKQILYTREQINDRISELGRLITEDYKDDPPVVIGVIKGALYFFSDLTRAIDLPIDIDMIGFGNIPDTTRNTGVVRITKDIDIDITGRRVLIVEDVIRTGLTTAYLISNLEIKKPSDSRRLRQRTLQPLPRGIRRANRKVRARR
ncbi:MAG: hypothetical protein IKH76_05730, partial [Clostridiales bacterium]|nr:hypothetical protein [Clostridiales bacterium]